MKRLTLLGLMVGVAACTATVPMTRLTGRYTLTNVDGGTGNFEVVIESASPVGPGGALDGGAALDASAPPTDAGPRDAGAVVDAGADGGGGGSGGLTTRVTNTAQLRVALGAADEHTVILAPGTYGLAGAPLASTRRSVTVVFESGAVVETAGAEEAFLVRHRGWTFRGAHVRVVGVGAYHAFKFNGATTSGGSSGSDALIDGGTCELAPVAESCVKGSSSGLAPYPDRVVIQNMKIFFTSPSTNSQVEGIDAVGVEGWVIRSNEIHHIQKASTAAGGSGGVGWGIVVKGGTRGTLIERNLLHDNDVHISVGGTSSSQRLPPNEHADGIVRANLMSRSRDVAIYLERARNTFILNNTLAESNTQCTASTCSAIDVRYAESSATVTNNILDKRVALRDSGTAIQTSNVVGLATADFIGYAAYDLRPRPGSALGTAAIDKGVAADGLTYDGQTRPLGTYDIGAYETTSTGPTPPPTNLVLTPVTGHGIPGVYKGGMALADFDRDGLLDVVAIGYWNRGTASDGTTHLYGPVNGIKARVYRNASVRGGAVRFTLLREYADLGGGGAEVVVGDWNGDGNLDFATQVRNGQDNTSYFGDGRGGFTVRVIETGFACASTSLGMAAGDIDKDGKDDIITNSDGYRGSSAALWYRWNGTAWEGMQRGFSHRMSYGGTLAVGDLDGDGFADVISGGNNARGMAWGTYDCSANLLYGEAHRNLNGVITPAAWFVIANYALEKSGRASATTPPNPARRALNTCNGGDNLQYLVADVDRDNRNDILVAGSSGFSGRPTMPGNAHYAFSIMRNVTGTALDYVTWENVGIGPDGGPGHLSGNQTNSGVGNLDYNGAIAVGDLNGDLFPEVAIQGHRRYLEVDSSRYIFGNMLFLSAAGTDFTWLPSAFPQGHIPLGECAVKIADLNGDSKNELIECGAQLPFHSNGSNPLDVNTLDTIKTLIFSAP